MLRYFSISRYFSGNYDLIRSLSCIIPLALLYTPSDSTVSPPPCMTPTSLDSGQIQADSQADRGATRHESWRRPLQPDPIPSPPVSIALLPAPIFPLCVLVPPQSPTTCPGFQSVPYRMPPPPIFALFPRVVTPPTPTPAPAPPMRHIPLHSGNRYGPPAPGQRMSPDGSLLAFSSGLLPVDHDRLLNRLSSLPIFALAPRRAT